MNSKFALTTAFTWLCMLARLCCLLALGCLLLPAATQAQAVLNLALEPDANQHRPLLLWGSYLPPGARYHLDSAVARQGRGSLHLHVPPAQADAPRYASVGTGLVPLDSVRGQLVTVSAWVRTRHWRGRAGLTASATSFTRAGLNPESVSSLDSLPANQDWRRLELRIPVKATAFSFYLGLQTTGSGDIWFDDVELRVRGRRLPEWPVPTTEALLLPPTQVLALNWDFERPLPALTRPDPAIATAALDSAGPQHGRRYLRAQRSSAPAAGGALPASAYLGALRVNPRDGGKLLRVMGYWRWTGGRGAGPAFAARLLRSRLRPSLCWRPDTLTVRTPPPPGAAWTSFAIELPIQLTLPGTDAEADTASLGAFALSLLLPGAGVVDVDNLYFTIDGQPYTPAGPPVPPPPTAAEIAWLRATAKPLRPTAPPADYQDLAALAGLLGAAQVVGLGEVTHGSHEGFLLNARLARYLLTQKGFNYLALEASPAACAGLNNYLRTGVGNPGPLLATLGEGWATTEVLALLRELRAHNQAHPAAPVQLAGIDVRQPTQALTYLSEQLLDADDDFAQSRVRQLRALLTAYRHPAPQRPRPAPATRPAPGLAAGPGAPPASRAARWPRSPRRPRHSPRPAAARNPAPLPAPGSAGRHLAAALVRAGLQLPPNLPGRKRALPRPGRQRQRRARAGAGVGQQQRRSQGVIEGGAPDGAVADGHPRGELRGPGGGAGPGQLHGDGGGPASARQARARRAGSRPRRRLRSLAAHWPRRLLATPRAPGANRSQRLADAGPAAARPRLRGLSQPVYAAQPAPRVRRRAVSQRFLGQPAASLTRHLSKIPLPPWY